MLNMGLAGIREVLGPQGAAKLVGAGTPYLGGDLVGAAADCTRMQTPFTN